MVGKIQLAIIGFLSVSGVFGAPKARLRRDETPSMPYDPDTTSHCTWWWDNDGSIACSDIPSTWGITLEDFRRWVSFDFSAIFLGDVLEIIILIRTESFHYRDVRKLPHGPLLLCRGLWRT